MKRIFIHLLATVFCFLAADAYAKITITTPPELPPDISARNFKNLTAARNALLPQFDAAQKKIDRQAENCGGVEEGSPKVSECKTEAIAVKTAAKEYRAALGLFKKDIADAQYAYKLINDMKALAKRLGWSAKEQERLAKALNKLDIDGDQMATIEQVSQTWQDVLFRGQAAVFAREASQGDGPGFPGAGEQTNFQDCAIFALANASGQPYGVVATRATKLISEGEWRSADERANPQKTIEQRGLNGGEVIMMAESLGQAEVIPSSDFARTLKEGRLVMVNVMPASGEGGHEVVLTKSFQHGGETWYEMMDSNQGPQRRLYLSDKELNTMLLENGVAFRPEPGTTPKLLR